jgi:response regulator RpfG family c-di-GMP phosphodiesterase
MNSQYMFMPQRTDFIIIDDDPINNKLCHLSIKKTVPEAYIRTFTNPEEGLKYLEEVFSVAEKNNTILYLDINMPEMNGWEFMEEFEKFNPEVRNLVKVYILSSSVNPHDKDKAKTNENITDYIVKPLTTNAIRESVKSLD